MAEPRHNKGFWSKGFTLAEVLITLGIIGVVAAVTIPTLVQNYQNRAWNTASTVFQRKLEEALKTMNTQQTLAGYKTTEDFVNELSNHFKMNKICKNNELLTCFSDKVYWGDEKEEIDMSKIKSAKDFGQKDWNTDIVGVQFANGVTGLIAYNPECTQNPYSNQITGTSCLAVLYDTDGFKNPNTQLKDLRSINVQSLGGKSCAFELDGTCFGAPFLTTGSLTKQECEDLKGELGINECCSEGMCFDRDTWAWGVKQCGHVSKMASPADVAKIADYLYNTSGIGAEEDSERNLTLDQNKVSELGFDFSSYKNRIWTNKEASDFSSYYREFNSGNSWYLFADGMGHGSDRTSSKWAVCIVE